MSKVMTISIIDNAVPNHGFANVFPTSKLEVEAVYNKPEALFVKAKLTPVDGSTRPFKVIFSDEMIAQDENAKDFMEEGDGGYSFKEDVNVTGDTKKGLQFSMA